MYRAMYKHNSFNKVTSKNKTCIWNKTHECAQIEPSAFCLARFSSKLSKTSNVLFYGLSWVETTQLFRTKRIMFKLYGWPTMTNKALTERPYQMLIKITWLISSEVEFRRCYSSFIYERLVMLYNINIFFNLSNKCIRSFCKI